MLGPGKGLETAIRALPTIAAQYPDELPHLEITDSPDLPVRGFMLDAYEASPASAFVLTAVANTWLPSSR